MALQVYYPSNDPSSRVCRQYILHGRCKYGESCRFYHPLFQSYAITRSVQRKLGFCYCGSKMRCIGNRKYNPDGTQKSAFFNVCSRTKKSIRWCM